MKNHKTLRWIWAGCVLFILATYTYGAPTYRYRVDLNRIVNDRFKVTLDCQSFASDTLFFCFPKIIPGTYQVSDYGRFIQDLKAFDKAGKPIQVKRIDRNRYRLAPAWEIARIEYWVNDTWDYKRLKLWGMAGTNIEDGRNFVWNNGGVFGFFQGRLQYPIEIYVSCPDSLWAMTALAAQKVAGHNWQINADSYYQLVDSPVMFAFPDTASFRVRSTRIAIGAAQESIRSNLAPTLAENLSPSVNAIASFLDTLPTNAYIFIYYFSNAEELGRLFKEQRFIVPKLIIYLLKNGVPGGGALEHCNSSFYYLPDLGDDYREELLKSSTGEIAIHEFMHTLTPLRLHSAIIGETDFITPRMSRHLWLYEGATEYLSHLIRLRGGLISPQEFLFYIIPAKIQRGEKYPYQKMSFTEMSTNVLQKKYQKHFLQVYQRGAVIAMLLDLEIMRLTEGEKDLATVLWELCSRYGVDRSFNEETFFDDFVALVHPELRSFFTKYVEGTAPLPYDSVFQHFGLLYTAKAKTQAPRHYLKDNDVKTAIGRIGDLTSIRKVGKKDFVGFQTGDWVNTNLFYKLFLDSLGNYLPAGTMINLPVTRAGQSIDLPVKIQYTTKTVTHRLQLKSDPNVAQQLLLQRWLKGKPVTQAAN